MDKLALLKLVLISSTLGYFLPSTAQDHEFVSKEERTEVLQRLKDSLAYYYVDYQEGLTLGNLLLNNEKKGVYASIKHPDSLAQRLTDDLRKHRGDLHLYVGHKPAIANAAIRLSQSPTKGKLTNYGFTETSILEGNIGYVKITHFSDWQFYEEAKEAITSTLKIIENTDSIIFDLRDNPGGVPHLASYLISYLFDSEPVHLTQYIHRYNNGGYGVYTQTNIPGKKLPHTPVYVLVNNKTASAGEEFAYWLKHQKRATIVGDTTAGGGYGVLRHWLNDRFMAYISSEEEKNPITGTNFQGIGVIPQVTLGPDEDALSIAKEMATQKMKQMHVARKAIYEELTKEWASISQKMPTHKILSILSKCHQANIADRAAINRMGYYFLNEWKSTEKAEEIFKLNVEFHPESPNVYDSYGEALETNGKLTMAASNFKKAYRLGVANNSSNILYFKENFLRLRDHLLVPNTEKESIESVLYDYINGTRTGDASLLKQAFHKDLNLYAISNEEALTVRRGKEYISVFEDGQARNRVGRIISIDYENNIATAKVEVDFPERKRLYVDYLMLMKVHGQWCIIHKSYTSKSYSK